MLSHSDGGEFLYVEEAVQEEMASRTRCGIIAAFRYPDFVRNGRVIRSPRILAEETDDGMDDLDE